MIKKSFRKKLSLNKKTIANLGTDKMSRVNGGIEETLSYMPDCNICDTSNTCNTCNTCNCPTNTCNDCQSDPEYMTCPCPATLQGC